MNPLRVLWLAAVAIAGMVLLVTWAPQILVAFGVACGAVFGVFIGADAGQRWFERSRGRHLDEIRDRDRTVRARRHGRPGERAIREYTRTRQEW